MKGSQVELYIKLPLDLVVSGYVCCSQLYTDISQLRNIDLS